MLSFPNVSIPDSNIRGRIQSPVNIEIRFPLKTAGMTNFKLPQLIEKLLKILSTLHSNVNIVKNIGNFLFCPFFVHSPRIAAKNLLTNKILAC